MLLKLKGYLENKAFYRVFFDLFFFFALFCFCFCFCFFWFFFGGGGVGGQFEKKIQFFRTA